MMNLISAIGHAMYVHPKINLSMLTTFRRVQRMLSVYSVSTLLLSYLLLDIPIRLLMSGKISYMQIKLSIQMSAKTVKSKRPIKLCGTPLLLMLPMILKQLELKQTSRKFTLLELVQEEDFQLSHTQILKIPVSSQKLKLSTMALQELPTNIMLINLIKQQKTKPRDILLKETPSLFSLNALPFSATTSTLVINMFALKMSKSAEEIFQSLKDSSPKSAGKFMPIKVKRISAALLITSLATRKSITSPSLKNDSIIIKNASPIQLFKLVISYYIIGMRGFHATATSFIDAKTRTSPRLLTERTVAEGRHDVTDYGLLNRALSTHMAKKKKKKRVQRFENCQAHCQSLEKLQLLHRQKTQQIKRHIYEKAEISVENEELRQLTNNPTLREHKLYQRIYELENENRRLQQELQSKDREKQHEIERIKVIHKMELEKMQDTYLVKAQQLNRQYKMEQIEPKQIVNYSSSPKNYPRPEQSHNQIKKISPNRSYEAQSNARIDTNHNMINRNIISGTIDNKNDQIASNKSYNVGVPVYISSNTKTFQSEMQRNKQRSPNQSKNTTSQTKMYSTDSGQNINYNHFQANTNISKQQRPLTIENKIITKQKQNYQTQKRIIKYEGNSMSIGNNTQSNYSNPKIINNPPKKSQIPGLYSQNDLQQIYKKYCIND